MSTKLELTEKENLNLRHQQLCYLLNQSLQELGENDPPPVILFSDKDTASLASSSSIPDKVILDYLERKWFWDRVFAYVPSLSYLLLNNYRAIT